MVVVCWQVLCCCFVGILVVVVLSGRVLSGFVLFCLCVEVVVYVVMLGFALFRLYLT